MHIAVAREGGRVYFLRDSGQGEIFDIDNLQSKTVVHRGPGVDALGIGAGDIAEDGTFVVGPAMLPRVDAGKGEKFNFYRLDLGGEKGQRATAVFQGHSAIVVGCVLVGERDSRVVSADRDGVLISWDARSGVPIGRHQLPGGLWRIAFCEKSSVVYAILFTAELIDRQIWSIEVGDDGQFENPKRLFDFTFAMDIAINDTGTMLAASRGGEMILWDVAEEKIVSRITNVDFRYWDIEFGPGGEYIAGCFYNFVGPRTTDGVALLKVPELEVEWGVSVETEDGDLMSRIAWVDERQLLVGADGVQFIRWADGNRGGEASLDRLLPYAPGQGE